MLEEEKIRWEKELTRNRQVVDAEKVAEVGCHDDGVPVQRIALEEGQRLLRMGDQLKGSVIGQDEAIEKVVKSIQRNRAGLKDPNKPIGSFNFSRSYWVGKTQLAKVLGSVSF